MKKLSLLLGLLIVLSSFTAKGPTFSLADSQVEVGAVYTLKSNFTAYSHELNEGLEQELEKVAEFLSKNNKLKVEIGVHSIKSGTEIITAERAEAIIDYLSKKGAKRSKLVAVGYANKNPIVTQRELYKLQTLAEKMEAKQKNERIEVKVLESK